jgi:hypothetical protein
MFAKADKNDPYVKGKKAIKKKQHVIRGKTSASFIQ